MERLRAPLLAQGAAHLLLHIALLIPSSTLSHQNLILSFLPAIWACDFYSWNAGFGVIAIGHGFWALEFIGFRDVRKDFSSMRYRPVLQMKVQFEEAKSSKEKAEGDIKTATATATATTTKLEIWKEQYPTTFWRRLFWVSNLICSPRYIGWAGSPTTTTISTPTSHNPAHKRAKPTSRLTFLLRELIRTAFCILLADIISFYTYFDPYFQISTSITEPFPRRLNTFLTTYHLNHIPPKGLRILIYGAQQYATLSLLVSVPAIFFVALGGLGVVGDFWGGTQNWVPAVGSWNLVWERGLRGWWGGVWHQFLRNILASPGKALTTRVLKLRDHSLPARVIKIVLAFTLSSFIHFSTLPSSSDPAFLGIDPLRYVSFFWIQGALVIVEVLASELLESKSAKMSRNLPKRLVLGVVRTVWVVGVLYLTAPLVVDEATRVTRAFGLKVPMLLRLPVK